MIMKRIFLILLFVISIYGNMAADGTAAAQINLQHKKLGGPRADDPVVEPEAFIDYFEHVIIIDGEMEEDDYLARFPDPSTVPGNITRVSDCDFETVEDLTEYIKELVSGLVSEAVIIIDNIVSLVKNPTGSDIFDMFRNLRKIQHEASVPISYIVANHLAKVPEGVSIDETLMAGSANITRFASSIAILDKSARGSDYRFLKILKERKNGVPADVIELEYTEKEYKHYNFFGTISEDEVLYTKTNRKRFGQVVVEEDPEEEESQNPRPRSNKRGIDWADEDTEKLKALMESGEELDYEAIAKEFGCSSKTIERRVKKLKGEGSEE